MDQIHIGQSYSVCVTVNNTSQDLEAYNIPVTFKEGEWGFWMDSWVVDSVFINSLAPGDSVTICTEDTYTQFGFASDLITWVMVSPRRNS